MKLQKTTAKTVAKTRENELCSRQTRNNLHVTANVPANDNGKLHNLQTDCATVRKTATKQLIKTHKNLFTVDKHVTIGNVTAKLPANVNGNCTMYKQAVQQ